MTNRLLILSCSAAKQHAHEPMPAIERYDGPAFRVVRKALSDGVIGPDTAVRIVSARHGLINGAEWIHDYDQRMTPRRAVESASSVSIDLYGWFQKHPGCDEVFVNVGRAYAPALTGLGDYCRRHNIPYVEAAGGIGQRLTQMRAWLAGRA